MKASAIGQRSKGTYYIIANNRKFDISKVTKRLNEGDTVMWLNHHFGYRKLRRRPIYSKCSHEIFFNFKVIGLNSYRRHSDYFSKVYWATRNPSKTVPRLRALGPRWVRKRVSQLLKWESLGKEGEPSALVLREPQVKEALAALSAASAQREKTRRDLKRTTIKAPYAGRVFERSVDVGQYVSPGTRLGRIYAIDYVEIPLPLSDRQLEFVDLPHVYRGEQAKLGGTKVTILVEQGSRAWTYPGRLVRTRGAVDARSRQTSVIAQVDDPYGRHGDRPPLKVGMFVKAEIEGRILPGSIVLPQAALREGRYVLLIDDQNQLQRMPVTIRWSEKDVVVIASGVKPGDLVCLTPVAYDVTGAKVIPSINGKVRRIESREAPQAP